MRRLILLRHGLTSWNAERRFQGQADIELTLLGHEQARAAAEALASYTPAALWTSDLSRALQTAEYVAEPTQLVPVVDERLREIDVGALQGLTYPEVIETAGPAPWDYTEHGGESDVAVGERFVAALRDLAAAIGPDDVAVVVSHGHAIRVGMAAFLGLPLGVRDHLSGLDNCGWVELTEGLNGGSFGAWRLAAYNRVAPIS